MPHWTKILIHDSFDNKDQHRTSDEIVAYHTGWKDLRAGEPLPEAVALHLIESGESGISRPWKDGGDHWHVSYDDAAGKWRLLMIRPMTSNGSHVREGNLNRNAVSVRLIPPRVRSQCTAGWKVQADLFEKLAILCKFIMKTYKIPVEGIFAHYEIDPASDCPKAWFPAESFRAYLRHFLSRQ